jgi:ABC-2 type transport system ATP-binding protein
MTALVSDPPPLLRTRGLTKAFGSTVAVRDLSVDVPAGRIGLVGANGAGKSTFFKLVLGLMQPTAGSIEVNGRSVAADPVGIRQRIGYMPEHECLPLDQSAADVVAMLGELSGLRPRDARQRASDMLDLVGLDEARFRPVGTYSTGMKQRVKLAQAIVADPDLVLLDEPTAGLDPTGRDEMLDLIARLGREHVSVVMSTHLLADVERTCEHVVMLDRGQLVVSRQVETLMVMTGSVTVEVDDGTDRLVAELTRRGYHAESVDGRIEVAAPDRDAALDAIRDSVAELGLPLTRLASRMASLDDVFLRESSNR